MKDLKRELEVSRGVNKVLIEEVHRLSVELDLEIKLHFNTIEDLLDLQAKLTNNRIKN